MPRCSDTCRQRETLDPVYLLSSLEVVLMRRAAAWGRGRLIGGRSANGRTNAWAKPAPKT